jgi:hypothetical protein
MKPASALLWALTLLAIPRAESAPPQEEAAPPKKEYSLVGTWKGKHSMGGTEGTVTLYVTKGGTYPPTRLGQWATVSPRRISGVLLRAEDSRNYSDSAHQPDDRQEDEE